MSGTNMTSPVTPTAEPVLLDSNHTNPSLDDLALKAKELSKNQVRFEERWKDCDRSDPDERKRFNSRISGLKQSYYTKLLEKDFTERRQENNSLREDKRNLQLYVTELQNALVQTQAQLQSVNSQLHQLDQQHDSTLKEANLLKANYEQASKENTRLKADPIFTAIRNSPVLLNIEATSEQTDVSFKVIDDVPATESSDAVGDVLAENSLESFLSPKANFVRPPSSAQETPSKQIRKLTLEVKYSSPQVPKDDIPVEASNLPDFILPNNLEL